jgi:hypothetical protein
MNTYLSIVAMGTVVVLVLRVLAPRLVRPVRVTVGSRHDA